MLGQNFWQHWLEKRFQFQQKKRLTQKDVLVFIYQQGYLYLVLILITFVAGINYANNLILGFCFLISAILCISFYLTFKQLHGLQLEVVAQQVGQAGENIQLHLFFQQDTPQLRYLWIQVDQQLHKLALSEAKQQYSLAFYTAQRGKFHYPAIQLYSVYPFGLVRAWTYLYFNDFAWIAPKAAQHTTENKHNRHNEEPDLDEFRELRSYQLGDSLQAVSWKQVARGQGLYVKVFEQYQNQQQLEIDYAQMPSTSHEEKLSLMMGLVEQCEQQQCAYALYLPQVELPAACGEQQLLLAKQLLAQA